ncbi:MAG: class I lanthipeptide [Bacteroidota bacterium]
MKKKKFGKKLDLGKKRISKLDDVQGGAAAPASHISCTVGGGNCTSLLIKTCTWYSELNTACCPYTQNVNCPSWGIVCPVDSRDVCEA